MAWRRVKLGDIFSFEKGCLQSSKSVSGPYDFITAAKKWKKHNAFSHDCEALVFAASASGSLGRVHYINGKFTASDLCFILKPKDPITYPINQRFYYRLLSDLRTQIVSATKSGTSKEAISQRRLKAYEIPYIDISLQNNSINIIDFVNNIAKELFSKIGNQRILLSKLRQAILQEAIQGKLTEYWRKRHPDVEPATELMKHIADEKDELVNAKMIRKQKPLPPITADEIPFKVPETWVWCRLGMITDGFQYGTSSKSLKSGKVPVLRMGNIQQGEISWDSLVFSEDDEEIEKYRLNEGDILFNRTNSRALVGKTGIYRGQFQAIHAGYLVRFHMVGSTDAEFTNYVMNSRLHGEWCDEVKTDAIGQSNINATKLSLFRFPLPSLSEQKIIVQLVRAKLALCDKLEAEIIIVEQSTKRLSTTILHEIIDQQE